MGTITVTNLGKAYKQYPTRWGRLAEWVFPFTKPRHELKWVLQDVSFTVRPGEAVGIIGINGAGKSTLLKMITGTTQSTTGSVSITGRVSAMLELGMGFHPDFTGRENAFMTGQLLGMSVEEIASLMPEIEAFAEIGDYMDQPVRVYSSGMQMRVAFSVATARRPDVLIVDEALSVGDAYFQHKSFERIREFRRQGTTLLIVSHDKTAIQSICDRAILLNEGRIAMEGQPEMVMDFYNALLADGQPGNQIRLGSAGYIQDSGTKEAVINSVAVKNLNGEVVSVLSVGEPIEIHVSVSVRKNISSLVLGCGFKDKYGQMIFGTNSYHVGREMTDCLAGDEFTYIVCCDANLGVGTYSVNVAIHEKDSHLNANYHWIDRALIIEVINLNKYTFVGLSWNPMKFLINDSNCGKRANVIPKVSERVIRIADASYGQMLVYANDGVIGRSLLQTGSFQESKIHHVQNFLQANFSVDLKLFVDVGANIGTHSIFALKECGFDGAICFEPDLNNYKLLVANISINGLADRIVTNRLALSNLSGEMQMELSRSNYGDHRIKAQSTNSSFGEEAEREHAFVPAVSIDDYVVRSKSDWSNALIWMNTQGHEGYIFDGGYAFIKSELGPRYIVSEFWPYGIERSAGFEGYFNFLGSCAKIYDLSKLINDQFQLVNLSQLRQMYAEMLRETEKEFHPHTDLLLII